jgi:type II secretory pathway pseudopilin PulG
LIELLVVITIIVILSAATIPMGLNFVRNYQVIGASQNVATMMQMSRGQAVKRNSRYGILLNFNYPQPGQYQYTSLDPNPMNNMWTGGAYPPFNPINFTPPMPNYGAVPVPPNNTADPDLANGIMSPHGPPADMPQELSFDPGAFNALLFRSDGSVNAVNAAGGGAGAVNVVGVGFQIIVRDPRTQLTRTVTVSPNGRVTVQQ